MEINEPEIMLRSIIKKVGKFPFSEKNLIRLLEKKECDLIDDVGFDSILFIQMIVEVELCFKIQFVLEELDINLLRKYKDLKKCITDKERGKNRY